MTPSQKKDTQPRKSSHKPDMTEDAKQRLVRDWKDGIPLQQLAKRFGIGERKAGEVVRAHNVIPITRGTK